MSIASVPEGLDKVTAAWVENALHNSGMESVLLSGIQIEPLDAANSTVARIHLRDLERDAVLPKSLFLKLCPEGHGFLGTSELAYYKRDYQGLANAPLVPSFAARGELNVPVSESLGLGYALLLADLTGSFHDNKLIEPDAHHAVALGRALGLIHAFRWGTEADPDGAHNLDSDLDRYLCHVLTGLAPVMDTLATSITVRDRERIERAFAEDMVYLRARAACGAGLTLVHGDPNPTNVLTPIGAEGPPNTQPLYLIDRQPFEWSLRLWFGASDLVHATVPYWSVAACRANEKILLESYHKTLLDQGVTNYAWEKLIADWRACLCHAVLVAVAWGSDRKTRVDMRWLWEAQLKRALAALRTWEAGCSI